MLASMVKSALAPYRQKRNFSITAEPSGQSKVAVSRRLRFVIQRHAATRLHFDLRLELDGVFKSWAVTKGPSLDPAEKRLAVEVEDHPLDYGDFEGTIPKGQYGGGTVQVWDRGFWIPEGNKTPQEALKSGDLKFSLEGKRLMGSWVLVRMRSDRNGGTRHNWLLIKHRDRYAEPGTNSVALADKSVASGRSMAQITAGKGKSPKAFMLARAVAARPNAVWNSHRARTADSMATDTGAASERSDAAQAVEPVAVKSLPRFVEPQLCKLVDRPPNTAGWAHEVKFDGYRAQLRVVKRGAVVSTRRGLDWTRQFSAIAALAKILPDCIVDGEIVAVDQHQMPSFAALQAALSERSSESLIFFAFDLLFFKRDDLRSLPLRERKSRLEKLLGDAELGGRIRYVEHFESRADTVLLSACKMGLEGIVSKKLDSTYRSGRSGYWTKAKCRAGHEVVLGGWTTDKGALRSLLAGVHRDGHLVYVGRIGTGYGKDISAQLLPKLQALTRQTSPFGGDNAPRKESDVRWLKPALVAEIEFAGWTATGMIRQAAFKGLRVDKLAAEVVAELPAILDRMPNETREATVKTTLRRKAPKASSRAGHAGKSGSGAVVMGITISKPEKALWADGGDGQPVTKLDLAHYFEQVGEWMMPHLAGRPCSLVRVPDGVGGQQFFQRHAMPGMSNLVESIKVRGDKAPYLQIDRVEALAAVAQIAALELHPWNCAPGEPEVAGRLVFDLDPAPDVKFEMVIAGALDIRTRLKALGLESFCKTTGGKGLHVVTPLTGGKQAVKWPVAKNFAHLLCSQMASEYPDKYLDNMSKGKRVGKIFLDYLRNDRTATAVAVLSPRARDGAPVSMPIDWKEVRRGLDPKRFTLRTAPGILNRSKPWSGYGKAARSLEDAIRAMTQTAVRKRSR